MAANKKILVTGFDPFGQDQLNASWEAVRCLPTEIGNMRIYPQMIPTTFHGAPKRVLELVDEIHPQLVMLVGQADGRNKVTPEKQALNLMNGRIPDNDGFQPNNELIAENGPDSYQTELPIEQIVAQMQEMNIPIDVSNDAGQFVCNCTYYSVGVWLQSKQIPCLFVHLPAIPTQAKNPNVSMKTGKATAILKELLTRLEKEI